MPVATISHRPRFAVETRDLKRTSVLRCPSRAGVSSGRGCILTRFRVALFILTVASLLAWPLAAHATPTFLSAINISDQGQDGFEPQVAIDGSGNVTAVWTRSDGTNFRIQSASRTPSGPWSAAQTLSDPLQSASQPQIAV